MSLAGAVVAGLLLILSATPGSARPSQVATGTDPDRPPASIDATGADDVTEALGRFIASVPDGGVIEFAPEARYRIEGTLAIVGRRDLTIDGNGATLFATSEGTRNRSHVRLEGGADLLVRDLVVVGAHPDAGLGDEAYRADREAQHGFDLAGATRVELDAVEVSDVYGDSVYVGSSPDGTWSTQVWIHDSRLTRTGRQGISVVAGRDVVIERNRIDTTRRASIDLEPNTPSQGAINVHILKNRIGPGRLLFVAAHGGGPVEDIVIADNVLQGRTLTISVTPPEGVRRANIYVVGNTSDTLVDRTPMTFVRVDGVVVRNNRQPLVPRRARGGEVGVKATSVCSLEVVDNNFGPGTVAVEQKGSRCGEPVASDTPPPPAIPARDDPPPATTVPEAPSPPAAVSEPQTASPPAAKSEPGPAAPSTGERWEDAIPAAAVVVLLVVVVIALRARRSRVRAARSGVAQSG